MNRQTGTKFLFSFLFIIAALFGIRTVCPAPAAITDLAESETLSHQPGQNPHSELEGTHFHLTSATSTLAQKNLIPSCLSTVPVSYDLYTSLENFQIRKFSLLIKDYLAFIYPTHNFW